MKIGVNALYLIPGAVGGTETYLRNLLRAFEDISVADEFYVFTNRETGPDLLPKAANFHRIATNVRASNRPWRLIWEQTALPAQVSRRGLDCLLNCGFTAPFFCSRPSVTVVHDLQHKRHPEHFRWYDRPAWNFFVDTAARRSKLLLTVSETTRADVLRWYERKPEHVWLTPSGVEEEFFSIAEQRKDTEPFLLCVSTLHPHKNIERLVRVFARIVQERPQLSLVLTGVKGFRTEAVEKLVGELGINQRVRITGWIPRDALYELYRRATAFVYPSTFEGFGLPVLEAMAAGVPLACSDIEPLRGISGGTAVAFDPHDDEALLAALNQVLSVGSDTQAARARARMFTWRQTARLTLAACYAATGQQPFSAEDPRAESGHLSFHRGTSR
jgi:glycosyltransferase involved in cell wall biosynthesis